MNDELENFQDEVIYKISPKFDFIYELFMPTGRKIKSTLAILIVFIIGTIFMLLKSNDAEIFATKIYENLDLLYLLKIICYISIGFLTLKLIFNVVFKALQYDHITYTFYKNHMIYEDDFLNQHKKVIQYANIKEIEIRRTIWDRIIGFGVIVIYTNAENEYSNGLVIYSIKNPKENYEKIYKIAHPRSSNENNNVKKEEKVTENIISNQELVEKEKAENDFLNSIKNTKE